MCSDIWFQMVGHIGCDLSSNLIFIQTTPNDRFWIYMSDVFMMMQMRGSGVFRHLIPDGRAYMPRSIFKSHIYSYYTKL